MAIQPIYSSANCNVAYQLNWSLSVFGKRRLPCVNPYLSDLNESLAKDELRILEYKEASENAAQFFVSSRPKHSPSDIVRLIKGRWQHIARTYQPAVFCRNYSITSCGTTNVSVLHGYVARQTSKHPMADARTQSILESLQLHNQSVDVAGTRRSSYGEFTNALHIVFETASGWNEFRADVLEGYNREVAAECDAHGWLLSRIGLLANHMHILMSAGVCDSPEQVCLELLNRLAVCQGSTPIFKHSYFVGTFGKYDRGAIWNSIGGNVRVREHNSHYDSPEKLTVGPVPAEGDWQLQTR